MKYTIIVEGKSDKLFFSQLLGISEKEMVNFSKYEIEKIKSQLNITTKESKIPFIIQDADYTDINTGYAKTQENLKLLQKDFPSLRYLIVSPEKNKDGILEDVFMDTIVANPNDFVSLGTKFSNTPFKCFDSFKALWECLKQNKVNAVYRKTLLGYYIACYQNDDSKATKGLDPRGIDKTFVTKLIEKSLRLQEIKKEIENIIQSI